MNTFNLFNGLIVKSTICNPDAPTRKTSFEAFCLGLPSSCKQRKSRKQTTIWSP